MTVIDVQVFNSSHTETPEQTRKHERARRMPILSFLTILHELNVRLLEIVIQMKPPYSCLRGLHNMQSGMH